MSEIVSDVSANRNDKIVNAAEFLSKSLDRRKIFEMVYKGKKDKTISEIMLTSKIGNNSNRRVRTLQELKKLRGEDMVELLEKKRDGELVYRKKDFYTNNWKKIISLSLNKKRRDKVPTKINNKIQKINFNIKIPKTLMPNVKHITIEDIDQFKDIKKIKEIPKEEEFYENAVKEKFKSRIGETGTFTDWGGEKNDLFSTNARIKGKRISAAFAFKGKGTNGVLTPKKMGKNGDQILRLFQSTGEIFFIQYNRQIDQSILEYMETFAKVASLHKGKKIYYGIIDGIDTSKIMQL